MPLGWQYCNFYLLFYFIAKLNIVFISARIFLANGLTVFVAKYSEGSRVENCTWLSLYLFILIFH